LEAFGSHASRPFLGAILLGLLLSYKPQLGFLAVIALATSALWRATILTAVAVGTFAAVSLFAFGAEPWSAWIRSLPEFATIVSDQRARLLRLMPTALSNALAFGASEGLAATIQTAVTAVAAAGVWFAFRRGRGNAPAAALAVASVLASPYVFVYDLTLVAAAIAVIAIDAASTLRLAEVLVLTTAFFFPAGIFLNLVPPVATLVHLATFAVILLHLRPIAHDREGESPTWSLPTRIGAASDLSHP
jgi:Glycosyltransferase family 87